MKACPARSREQKPATLSLGEAPRHAYADAVAAAIAAVAAAKVRRSPAAVVGQPDVTRLRIPRWTDFLRSGRGGVARVSSGPR